MDPLQAMFVGGWPAADEEFGPAALAPRGQAAGPTVVVAGRQDAPVVWPQSGRPSPQRAGDWPVQVVALPAPRPPIVFPTTAPGQPAQQVAAPAGWTHGSPDKTVRHTRGVATFSPFGRDRIR